jgi:cell division protein FtsA
MRADREHRAGSPTERREAREAREGLRLPLGRSSVLAVVDLGAAKVTCLILTNDGVDRATGGLTVAGVGHVQSRGVRDGAIVDVAEASRAIGKAVDLAEAMARVEIQGVTLVTACGYPASHRASARVTVAGREIHQTDLDRAAAQAISGLKIGRRRAIHFLPIAWSVDGQARVRDPRGMVGRTLGLEMIVVSIREGFHQTLVHCVERAHLDFHDVMASPYASALATLQADELELGALCIDMGAGATSAAVFSAGALAHIDAVPLGGAHVTKDVAIGLTTSIAAAERIKTLDGSAIASPSEDREMIEAPPRGDDPGAYPVTAPRSMLKGIIAPRVEETLELLRDRLRDAGVLEPAAGVVLVGGASQLVGAREVAARVFDRTVRMGRTGRIPQLADAAGGPGYAAAAGVLQRAAFGPRDLSLARAGGGTRPIRIPPPDAGVMSRAAHWLWNNF